MNTNNIRHIEGEDHGHIMLYALSTCMWCRKTKLLLDDLGVAYDVVDVDLLEKPEQNEATEEISKWNPSKTFPTVVINDDKCIVGYSPDELQAELKK
ncbi:MAG: glutaredoxin family protein [Thermoleophilia bacterium]